MNSAEEIILETKLLRLARLMNYKTSKIPKADLMFGLATTCIENKAALQRLEDKGKIVIDKQKIILIDKKKKAA